VCLVVTVCVAVQQEPRIVQLMSYPFLGQDVLRAGPSQFGLNLKDHKGVSVTSLSLFHTPSRFDTPRAGSGVESIDPLHFTTGCRKR